MILFWFKKYFLFFSNLFLIIIIFFFFLKIFSLFTIVISVEKFDIESS
jgi:hypothetical protein